MFVKRYFLQLNVSYHLPPPPIYGNSLEAVHNKIALTPVCLLNGLTV